MKNKDFAQFSADVFERSRPGEESTFGLISALTARFKDEISRAPKQVLAVEQLINSLNQVGHRFEKVSITDLAELGLEGEDIIFEAHEVIAEGTRLLSIQADDRIGLRVTFEEVPEDFSLFGRQEVETFDLDRIVEALRQLVPLERMVFVRLIEHGLRGVESAVDELQKLGWDFGAVAKQRKIYSWTAETHKGCGRLVIVASLEDCGWVSVSLKKSEATLQAKADSIAATLSLEEKQDHELQEAFYARAMELSDRFDDYEILSEPDQLFIAVHMLEGEVNNGGFEQYFDNTEGYQARDAVRFLEMIGADSAASLARAAMALFPADWNGGLNDEIYRLLDDSKAKLEELDDKFYEEAENIGLLAMRWRARVQS